MQTGRLGRFSSGHFGNLLNCKLSRRRSVPHHFWWKGGRMEGWVEEGHSSNHPFFHPSTSSTSSGAGRFTYNLRATPTRPHAHTPAPHTLRLRCSVQASGFCRLASTGVSLLPNFWSRILFHSLSRLFCSANNASVDSRTSID
jgi:hypothetical protein